MRLTDLNEVKVIFRKQNKKINVFFLNIFIASLFQSKIKDSFPPPTKKIGGASIYSVKLNKLFMTPFFVG